MRATIMILTCVALLGSAEAVRAAWPPSTPGRPAIPGAEPSRETATRNDLGLKSPGSAARLSLAATIVPFWGGILLGKNEGLSSEIGGSLAVGGILVGPSVGYFYGGCSRRAVSGIAIRAGLLAVMAIAATQAEFPSLLGSDDEGNAAAGITAMAFCGVGVATVYDLVQVSSTVRRQNDRRLQGQPSITLTARVLDGSSWPACGFTVTF